MNKIFGLVLIISVIVLTGCGKVGSYQEGTYFGYDEDSKYTAVVYIDDMGEIKSVFLDAPYVTSDTQITTTKQILGDDYGMAESETDKEWYEQAEIFADKVIEEQGLDWVIWNNTEETDLSPEVISGVTISADGMYAAVNMALEQAK